MRFSIWKVFVSSWLLFFSWRWLKKALRQGDIALTTCLLRRKLPSCRKQCRTRRCERTSFGFGLCFRSVERKVVLLDLSTCSAETLDDCLKKFYISLKIKKAKFINAAVPYPHGVPFNTTSLLSRDATAFSSSKFVKKIHQPLRQGKRYHGLEICRLCESRRVCRNWPQERRKYRIL